MRRSAISLSRILHHEWITQGKISTEGTSTNKETVLFLHGLLGSGKNLRTTAKRFTEKHPHLSALLLDARGHGLSTSSQNSSFDFNAPHTMENCALDVIETLKHLKLTSEGGIGHDNQSPIGVIGHSFGARIALEYLHILANKNMPEYSTINAPISPPLQTWLLDSVPGNAHSSVANVIQAVSLVSIPIESKKHLVEDLTKNKGIDPTIATWMTTNLIPAANGKDGFQFAFDLNIVLSILSNFARQDFFQLLKNTESASSFVGNSFQVNIVRALKNDSWTPNVLNELNKFDEKFLKLHSLNTGHWVHIDDLNSLLDLMEDGFRK